MAGNVGERLPDNRQEVLGDGVGDSGVDRPLKIEPGKKPRLSAALVTAATTCVHRLVAPWRPCLRPNMVDRISEMAASIVQTPSTAHRASPRGHPGARLDPARPGPSPLS